MKRFLLLASMVVFIAAGCTKTTIQNEFQKTMDFSVQSGKLTRAIVQDGDYYPAQNFGVFAFGYQTIEDETSADAIMSDVMIKYYPATESSAETSATPAVWKAAEGVYFWPNDPRTVINFYAYSPYCPPASSNTNSSAANHQKLNGTVSCDDDATNLVNDGIAVDGYVHSNMYVDFMVATPVKGATYTEPDGNQSATDVDGKVPVVFAHKMTQIVFKVQPSQNYAGVTFTVNKITLNNIKNEGDYNVSEADAWTTDVNAKDDYVIFPAKKITTEGESATPNGAPGLQNDETAKPITTNNVLVTQPVTMIPQTLAEGAQSFTIEYTIEGDNVADETVVKTIDFASATPSSIATEWAPNKKITYILNIGLNEITFEPEVSVWDPIVDSDDIDI